MSDRKLFGVIIDMVMKDADIGPEEIKRRINAELHVSGYGKSHHAVVRVSHIDSLKNRIDVGIAPRDVVTRLAEVTDASEL